VFKGWNSPSWRAGPTRLRVPSDDLFAGAYHRIVGAVAVVTGDERVAEDATQEAFARAHR
jgi:hypothetical protein